ncbi:MAG: LemA family protein [Bacteroidota bacterium]
MGLVLIFGVWGCSQYNGIVTSEQGIKKQWGNVQAAYQARMDKYNTIVDNIKAEGKFEESTLTNVTKARYEANNVKLDPNNPATINQMAQAQANLKTAINVIFENYPQLQTTAAYRDFQGEIVNTENEIKFERKKYGDAVSDYNNRVIRFPGNIFAGIMGKKEINYFEAEPEAKKVPKLNY